MSNLRDKSKLTDGGCQETETEREPRRFWIQVPLTVIGVCGFFLAEAMTEYSLIGYFFRKDVYAPLILLLVAALVVFVVVEIIKRLKNLTTTRRKR